MRLLKKIRNIPHGFRGLRHVWHDEAQFPVQVTLVIIAIGLALLVQVSMTEFLILIIALFLALGSEVINTAVEELCDKVEPSHHPHIGKIKDISQAFVYVASIPAVVVMVTIILPRLFEFI